MNTQHTVMSDELFRLFERKLNDVGLVDIASSSSSETQALPDSNAQPEQHQALSFAEERAWMMHQHDPLASSGPFVLALRLKGKIDLSRLSKAIEKLYIGTSNLNLRYDLDQEGVLRKYHADQSVTGVDLQLIRSEQEAIQALLAWIEKPIDLKQDAAIQFRLFAMQNDDVILGILGHHILLDDTAWQPIFTQLTANYQQPDAIVNRPSATTIAPRTYQSRVVNTATALKYWKNQFPAGLNTLQWPVLFLASSLENTITHHGQAALFRYEQKAVRCSSVMPIQALTQLSECAQSSLFHTIVASFGHFLTHLLDKQSIDLFVPIVEQYDASSLAQIQSSSNVLPIRITRPGGADESSHMTDAVKDSMIQVRNQILQGMSNNLSIEQILSAIKTKRHAIPNVLVTQFIDSSQYLNLEGVQTSTLVIPPIHSDYDLTLAFQLQQDEIHFELTTGAKLSQQIAGFLLEKWIEFCHQDLRHAVKQFPRFSSSLEDEAQSKYVEQSRDSSTLAQNLRTAAQPNVAQSSAYASITHLILEEFKSVLMNPELQADDNFFDFGGHSILATRVIGKLHSQHGVVIKIADFFNAPSASELSQYATQLNAPIDQTTVQEEEEQGGVVALTLLQKAFMGFSDQGRDAMYNIPFAFRLSEEVDEQAFYAAFVDILQRHHVLRSIFVQADQGEVFQTVVPMQRLDQHPWFWGSETQGEQSAQQILAEEARHSFDLMQAFPIRVRFVKDEQGQHILSLLLYHIAMDEWSSGILIRELFQAYVSRVAGQALVWENKPRQFHEYAMAQDDENLQAHLQYWMNSIGRIQKQPPLLAAYATDEVAQSADLNGDVTGAAVEFTFNAAEVEQLYALARQYRSSLFYVVYAAVVLATYYLGAGKKILTGTSVACRQDPLYQDTVGYFTNVVMHYCQFNEQLTIKDLVNQVQNNIFQAQEYADIPFAMVEDNIRAEGEQWTESPYEVYVQLHAQNALTGAFQLNSGHEISFELIEPPRDSAKFGLHFEVYEEPMSEDQRLRVVINYRVNRYNETQIQIIQQVTQRVLQQFIQIDTQSNACMQFDVMELRRQLTSLQLPDLVI